VTLERIAEQLTKELKPLKFSEPVTHVYNPLEYAWDAHRTYLERYGRGKKKAVMIGMNPGPWGMAQTGVPFGEVALVRDWLGISAPVSKPKKEHPKRPIEGFGCTRSEVSGARLWGWVRDTFGTPEKFFSEFFVANYCPLVFMEESGKNRTPDKLPPAERKKLLEICDRALRSTIEALSPSMVIGVGAFAEGRAAEALAGMDLRIGRILHPSPASPLANANWGASASADMKKLGIKLP
jgi:single-strand selective monofunctional uracil DNA glycosylase